MSNLIKFCVATWVFGFALPNAVIAQETITEKKAIQAMADADKELPTMFQNHSWLKKVIDPVKCSGEQVTVHKTDNGSHFFMINMNKKRLMYNSDGEPYCTNSETLKCEEFYKLSKAEDTWTCKT